MCFATQPFRMHPLDYYGYRLILHWKNVIGIFCVWLPCSTFTLIGAFVVYFFFKMRKEDRQNELTKERPVKWWNKAKIIGYGLLLSMMPQKHLKKRTISNTEIRWTVALLQFSSLCSSCSSSPCIDKMDCQFYLFQNELFAGHTHNRPIDENNFLYFQSFIEKATFILVLINLKYLFQ